MDDLVPGAWNDPRNAEPTVREQMFAAMRELQRIDKRLHESIVALDEQIDAINQQLAGLGFKEVLQDAGEHRDDPTSTGT